MKLTKLALRFAAPILTAMLLAPPAAMCAVEAPTPAARPNVLLICVDDLDEIDRLLASGAVEQALSEVHRLRKALPPTARLTAWEIDFRGEVLRVVQGRECLYYQLHLPNAHKDAPGRQGVLGSVSANFQRSDWEFAVVCVDLKTGRIRWSRGVNGLAYLAVDPRTDALYVYHERLLSLDPDSGKVIEQQDPPRGQGRIRGLLLGQALAVPEPHGSRPIPQGARLLLYDPSCQLTKEVNVADYWLLAPDESRRLVPSPAGWDCLSVPDNQKLWTLPAPAGRAGLPLWHGGHPTFICGTEWQRGVVTSIDRATGKPRWSTALGWGAYVANQHQLRGGGYQDNLSPLAALDEHLLALDGSGRLYFLDPASGRSVATRRLCRNLLAMPVQRGGQLIVVSFDWIRSYSIDSLLRPEASLDAALQTREARCLCAQGKHKEALVVLDRLVERAPQLAAAWSQRADACKAIDEVEEDAYSRCQSLSLSSQSSDDVMHGRWGLLRLYNLDGKPCWSLAEVSGQVYVGTLAGGLWSVQSDTLELRLLASLDHEITSLVLKTELQAVLGDSTHTRRSVPRTPAKADDRIPREWYTAGGEQRISQAVAYRGRQFRSMRGGAVRVLSGTEMTDLPPRLDGVGDWRIHIGPAGPLGYGTGVFELDEDLRPIRWLIRPAVSGERPEQTEVMFLQATSASIGLVVASSNGAALQAYSRQGELLNEAALGRFISSWPGPAQLVPTQNGYLFSDRQLVWISAGLDRRVWRFGPSLARTSTDRWGDRWRYFGDPLLIHGCLYVTDLDGHLYVFDSARVF